MKLQARLLPELYDTRSNYQLIASITYFKIMMKKKRLLRTLLEQKSQRRSPYVLKTAGNIEKEPNQAIKMHVIDLIVA